MSTRAAPEYRQVHTQRPSDQIVKEIWQLILRGELKPGDRLPPERELLGMINGSRLPLREALCMLKALGIIEARHGKGIFVRPLDLGAIFSMLSPLLRTRAHIDVRHIFDVRLHLEASIAELAAAHRSNENLQRLQAAHEAMQTCLRNRRAWNRHDMDFHQELARSTGNPIFPVFMASITDLVREVQFLYRDKIEFRQESVGEHQRILDAVRRQDGAAARAAIQEHIRNATARL